MFQTIIGEDLQVCSELLRAGEAVAVPTETVYGLAANALNPASVLKIFEIKNRPQFDPLIVHVKSARDIHSYVENIPALAQQLIDKFSPGPITFLLPKKSIIPDLVTSGLDTVAIRIPSHPLLQKLLHQLDFPLAAPSANPFGYISPTTSLHVYEQLQGKLPYILEGGPSAVGVESTIVGFDQEQVIVYRPGGLPIETIKSVTGKVILNSNESSNPVSPGLLKSHYAPSKLLKIYQPGDEIEPGTALIGFNQTIPGLPTSDQYLLSSSGNLSEAASKLFSTMRLLDQSEYSSILAVKFPEVGLGIAINDRLKRAAAQREE